MNLVPLFEEALEFQDYNGTVLSDGKVAVYYIGRTRLADIYEDVDGSVPAENPRILNNLGMGPVYVNPAFDYEMVVFDAYGSELFSVKKYLASKGEHSTANVVVTPSESIAVSAWTVGDVQVYMPYLTGQLGKVYTGIEPIVVNNVEDKISANHVPLGVQDPLYFVQDDEEACIIGCSAQTEIPSALSGKWDNASDAVITNSAQWSENTTYEAGSYVDINGHTINVTGLQPAGNYQSAGDYVVHDELSSYATQDWVENQSYMKEYMESAFYPSTSNPSGYLTEHQDLSDYAKTEDLTAYQPVGNYYSASNPDGFINSDAISAMATTGLVADVSGDITGLIPDTSDMATKTWVGEQGYLTEHQSLDGLMSASLLESSGGLITGYNGSAFAGQGGGGVTGDFELSAGSGISIEDFPLEQKTVISVTAQGGNPEVEQAVIDNSATWDSVTSKADVTAIPSTAGLATENWVTGQGYITNDAITGKQDITGMTAYATVESLTAKQDVGDYLSATDSANFLLTSDSAIFYPMNENPSGYLTEHQSLADYQTTAGMTAYMTTGDSAEFMTTAERSDYIPTGVSSEFYTTANTAGYISEVPDTYLQNTDLSTEDGKVTAISGIPLSAGGDVPEGVMVESGLEYNAVSEISGYNGSAIAQYGAEKQFIVHDDTLVHLSNSAQYALGCNISALQRLMGIDETVLWESDTTGGQIITAGIDLSEAMHNFKEVKFVYRNGINYAAVDYISPHSALVNFNFVHAGGATNAWMQWSQFSAVNNGTKIYMTKCKALNYGNATSTGNVTITATTANDLFYLYQVIGIGRKQ